MNKEIKKILCGKVTEEKISMAPGATEFLWQPTDLLARCP
jgi:hypothetical protein